MKLPSGDSDLCEEEVEGLVSYSDYFDNDNGRTGGGERFPYGSRSGSGSAFSPSSRSKISSSWRGPVSSKKVGRNKKCLVFIAILIISGALVSLTTTNDEGVKDLVENNNNFDSNDKSHLVDHGHANGHSDTPAVKLNDSIDHDDDDDEGGDGGNADDATDDAADDETIVEADDDEDRDGSEEDDEKVTETDDGEDEANVDESQDKDNEKEQEESISASADAEVESKDVESESEEESEEAKEDVDADATGDKDVEADSDAEASADEDADEDAAAEAKKEKIIEQWGKWHFWDGDPDSRPKGDYMADFPNRDMPYDEISFSAWQADAVYVNHMLDSAAELVSRAKEAIYTEYGYGPKQDIERDALIARMDMFRLDLVDLEDPLVTEATVKTSLEKGGWTTRKSFQSLARRLLHAMMTNDTFTVVMGGHSAAAGHGNHFLQSYMMQFHKVLEPVFKRVGVKLITRNVAMGGLGTMQHSLGSKDIYGEEIDVIVWDSHMTEPDAASLDLFYRQALLGGNRKPVLWGGNFNLLRDLHLNADVDVMFPGSGMHGVKETEGLDQVQTLPFATQYLKCGINDKELCTDVNNKFRATCWIDRDDVTPTTRQQPRPGGQASWHPGFRHHQLVGRSMAMVILDAMQDAIDTWSEITIVEGHPLNDEYWHMSDVYSNIAAKVSLLDATVGACNTLKDKMPERICTTPMNGRTEFAPRANPHKTSLTSLLKPSTDGYIPESTETMLYQGPDVPNPMLMIPEGQIDVEAIVVNRRRKLSGELDLFKPFNPIELKQSLWQQNDNKNDSSTFFTRNQQLLRRRDLGEIRMGKGWVVDKKIGDCDGTSTGICGREPSNPCLLYGHMDHRGGIIGDALSGWLVFELPKIENGLIIAKFDTWHFARESKATVGWTEVNDGEFDRSLKELAPPLPDDFIFDYAIDGKITSLNLDQFRKMQTVAQRVVEIFTILDKPDMETKENVEVAFRLRNCGRGCVFKFTHMYWS